MGKPCSSSTGRNEEYLRPSAWDVSDLHGQSARIVIVDHRQGSWGHINVDQIVQTDRELDTSSGYQADLNRAIASTHKAGQKVANDPDRPTFHVLAPGNWINDPNGPIYYKGFYHLFYQHNPYGDDWGNMHWGHVRSRDLAHWEHLPIALAPSKAEGEDHVFSGCATIGPDGKPMIFYTSIGPRLPEQWAAVPLDDDLTTWKKHPANPVLTEALHGDVKVHEWRDPFIFPANGHTYMVLGGNLNGNKGGEGVVNVYRAENESLTAWKYLGVLFQHPDQDVKNVECPLFFPLDGRWVLIVSQGRPVDWFVGDLNEETMRFTPTARGKLDLGEVYAPNVLMNDPKGRRILWGWVNGFPAGRGWRHCLTLPRVLSIGPDGTLRQAPVKELEALRGSFGGQDPAGQAIELHRAIERGGVEVLRRENGQNGVRIAFDGETLDVAGLRVPLKKQGPLDLHVFVDHAVMEVYADDGRLCVTKVVGSRDRGNGVQWFGTPAAPPKVDGTWPIQTIWKNLDK